MNVDVINEYHKWAARGYVTRLFCRNHPYHDLVPVQDGFGITLICPQDDLKRELGLVEYNTMKAKISMAEMLFQQK